MRKKRKYTKRLIGKNRAQIRMENDIKSHTFVRIFVDIADEVL